MAKFTLCRKTFLFIRLPFQTDFFMAYAVYKHNFTNLLGYKLVSTRRSYLFGLFREEYMEPILSKNCAVCRVPQKRHPIYQTGPTERQSQVVDRMNR